MLVCHASFYMDKYIINQSKINVKFVHPGRNCKNFTGQWASILKFTLHVHPSSFNTKNKCEKIIFVAMWFFFASYECCQSWFNCFNILHLRGWGKGGIVISASCVHDFIRVHENLVPHPRISIVRILSLYPLWLIGRDHQSFYMNHL